MPRTRLAPSPTGALHLGNARTFLVNWAMARREGWDILLRIEDLDGPRVKPEAAAEAIEVLDWLGLDWDEGPLYQRKTWRPTAPRWSASPRKATFTRADARAARSSSPRSLHRHGDEHELRYPGTCRPQQKIPLPRREGLGEGCAWRLRLEGGMTAFTDNFVGRHAHDVEAATGDFLVATKEGLPSYQLAVVVDDARQRNRPHRPRRRPARLDPSATTAARATRPRADSRVLALAVGSRAPMAAVWPSATATAASAATAHLGVTPEYIVGLMAEWCGLGPRRQMSASEFLDRFDLARLPRTPIVFTPNDDAWLLQ